MISQPESQRGEAKTGPLSGLMLGLGETDDEVVDAMRDLRRHDLDMLTVGQYLQPPGTPAGAPLRSSGRVCEARTDQIGFAHVACGPLVRSSYHAERQALAAGALRHEQRSEVRSIE